MLYGYTPFPARLRRVLFSIISLVGSSAFAAPLTLEQAWHTAESANPSLRMAQANLAAAEGQLADARGLLWNNPQLSAERIRRDVPQAGLDDERRREWNAGLSQAFEIAGQQGYRRDAATQELAALKASLEETRRQVRADVERRFVRVLSLQQRMTTEEEALKLVSDAAVVVRKRVSAGEDSRLDGNLAAIEAERGRNQFAALGEQLTEARAELASALQLPAEGLPEVVGELAPATQPFALEQLLDSAAKRPQSQVFELREASAKSRLALERASAYPDITVGLNAGREGPGTAREKLVGLSLSIPLPLFRRNETGIGKATTELTQAQIDRQVISRDTLAQVRALWLKVESLRARVRRLEEVVVASLDENQRLSAKSYKAGEIGLLQMIVVNRQTLDGRRDLLDARTELRLASIALEAAAGWSMNGDSK